MPSRKWDTKEPGRSSACQQRGWRDVSNDLIEQGALNWSCKVLIQQLKGAGGTETKTQRHRQYKRLVSKVRPGFISSRQTMKSHKNILRNKFLKTCTQMFMSALLTTGKVEIIQMFIN